MFMSVRRTRELINKLFQTQMGAARTLKFAPRTVRWWCEVGAPPHVAIALDALDRQKISIVEARRQMRNERSRRVYAKAA